jgi:hypothetical protein
MILNLLMDLVGKNKKIRAYSIIKMPKNKCHLEYRLKVAYSEPNQLDCLVQTLMEIFLELKIYIKNPNQLCLLQTQIRNQLVKAYLPLFLKILPLKKILNSQNKRAFSDKHLRYRQSK